MVSIIILIDLIGMVRGWLFLIMKFCLKWILLDHEISINY